MTRMRVFWSVYFIILGLLLLLKLLFRWDFSAWSAALALMFFESGIFLLTGSFGMRRRKRVQGGGLRCFFNGEVSLPADDPQVSLLLSSADVLLSPPMNRLSVVRCAFSSVTVRVPQGYSVRAVCQSAFGSISAPDGDLRGFHDRVIIIGDGLQTQLQVQCLFSQVTILD